MILESNMGFCKISNAMVPFIYNSNHKMSITNFKKIIPRNKHSVDRLYMHFESSNHIFGYELGYEWPNIKIS